MPEDKNVTNYQGNSFQFPPISDSSVNATPESSDYNPEVSTIQKKSPRQEIDAGFLQYVLSAAQPMLPLPTYNTLNGPKNYPGISGISNLEKELEAKSTLAILDYWQKDLEDQAKKMAEEARAENFMPWLKTQSVKYLDRIKNKNNSKMQLDIMSSAEYLTWLALQPPKEREKEHKVKKVLSLQLRFAETIKDYLESVRKNGGEGLNMPVSFMATCFTIGTTLIGDFMVSQKVVGSNLTGGFVIQEVWEKISHRIPQPLDAELSLILSLFVNGLIDKSTIESIAASLIKGAPQDSDFAKLYAIKTIQLVYSVELNAFIMTLLIGQMEKGHPLSGQRIIELSALLKATMLCLALALLYKTETGGVSGGEFAGMFNKEIVLKKEDLKSIVMDLIIRQMEILPEKERQLLFKSFMEYLDSSPSMEELLDPSHVFKNTVERQANTQEVRG